MIQILPEWAPQQALWTAWPSHPDQWMDVLAAARLEVAAMVRAIAQHQRVNLLVLSGESENAARAVFAAQPNLTIIPTQFGDIWLRDTGPIFARDDEGTVALGFRFNGWGGKYQLPHDDEVASFIAGHRGVRFHPHDFVLEGGSLDFDGDGRVLTTRQCLLNPNRNPGLSQNDLERRLRDAFGIDQIIWLDQGLLNDHTDGHIDNIARFVAPGRVVCAAPSGHDDPNAATLDAIARDLEKHKLDVVRIPSPGLIAGQQGKPVAASHMNFVIANGVVVMPSYEECYAPAAVATLAPLFPDRQVIALSASHLLGDGGDSGGGSFHCITQQEPA